MKSYMQINSDPVNYFVEEFLILETCLEDEEIPMKASIYQIEQI